MKKYIIFLIIIIMPFNVKAIDINASSYVLMDMDTNRVIIGKNIHNIRSVASISKIMTAHLAIKSKQLNKKVIVGDEISNSYGSSIYIKKQEVLTIKDLLYGLMLRSGNDASLVIAKNVGNSVDEFIKKMNKEAKLLNMNDTTFNNPNGLDEEKGNYSSAYDMALLTSASMKYKNFREIVKTMRYDLKTNKNTYSWINKNKLLKMYKYSTGGKTGYTKKAKRTLVTTASKNNMNLVVVTLNDGNDFNDHIKLFEYGFSKYKKYQILKKGNINIKEEYYKNYKFYIKKNFYYLLDKIEKENIIIKFEIYKKKNIVNNIQIGKIKVYLMDTLIYEDKLYIKKEKND